MVTVCKLVEPILIVRYRKNLFANYLYFGKVGFNRLGMAGIINRNCTSCRLLICEVGKLMYGKSGRF